MHSVGLSQNGSHTCMRASSMEGAACGACEVICRVTQGCRVQLDPITVLTVPTPEEVLGGEDDALDGDGRSSSDVTDGFLSCLANQNRESNSSDSSTSSASSIESTKCRRRHQRSRVFQSTCSREALFHVRSAANPVHRRDVYHVVTRVHRDLQENIRINDRILEINELNVKYMGEREFNEYLDKLSTISTIKLITWRWEFDENGPAIRQRTVVIRRALPRRPSRLLSREFSRLSLGDRIPRDVRNFKWITQDFIPYFIRIASETGLYICADMEDMTLKGKPMKNTDGNTENFRFLVRFYSCMVKDQGHGVNIRLGFVARHRGYDVSSVIVRSQTQVVLTSQAPYDTENPDERFLLKLEVLNDDNFFESLIYKSVYMKYNEDTTLMTMAFNQGPGPTCRFQTFQTRGPHSAPKLDDSAIAKIDGDMFVFVPISEGVALK
uniref:Uncharacterized protein LOC111100639 n=1 Tax=Crassostrea virginica TaxID=6565 RepID=A0A8B8AER1_CRAVI|nr:uncharacterized protein LOC111100639 [Crassostrea virginica]